MKAIMKKINYLVIFILFLSFSLFAATAGKLKGVVTDINGTPLENANITIKGTTLGNASDSDGFYYITGIRGGTYTVNCQYMGYKTHEQKIRIRTGLTSKCNFQLYAVDFDFGQTEFIVDNYNSGYPSYTIDIHTKDYKKIKIKDSHQVRSKKYFNVWQNIHSFINNNQPHSLRKNLDSLYIQACASNDERTKLRVHAYRRLKTLEEFFDYKQHLSSLKKDLKKCKDETLRSFYAYLIGKTYNKIFDKYKYSILYKNSSSRYPKKLPDFLKLVELPDLADSCDLYYQLSTENADLLKKGYLNDYQDLFLIKDEMSNNLCRTLYEFFSCQKIYFYSKNILSIIHPQVDFKLSNPDYFGDYNQFISLQGKNEFHGENYKNKALNIFFELSRFYQESNESDSYLNLTLKRLEFIKHNYKVAISEKYSSNYLYTQSLSSLYENHRFKTPFYTRIAYELAINRFNEKKFSECLKICNEVLKNDSSNTLFNLHDLKYLKTLIFKPSINIQTASAASPSEYNKALITYRNVDTLYYKIFKSDSLNFEDVLYEHKVTTGFKVLPKPNNYEEIQYEILLPKLEPGIYKIIYYTDKKYLAQERIALHSLNISNLTYLNHWNSDTGKLNIRITDRITGEIIKNGIIEIKSKKYHIKELVKSKEGVDIHLPYSSSYSDEYKIKIKTAKDSTTLNFIFPYNHRVFNPNYAENQYYEQIFLFNDKVMYKPGQKVKYKGISVKIDTEDYEQSKISSKKEIIVYCKDRNGKLLYEKEHLTSDFGSFSGEMIIPENVLTGSLQLEATYKHSNNNYHYSRTRKNLIIEEYKKPNFYLKIIPNGTPYVIGDSVNVKGEVRSLAEFSLANCKIKYEIYLHEKIMHEGRCISNSKGKFNFKFATKGDQEKFNPRDFYKNQHYYNIKLIATDLNGETQLFRSNLLITDKKLGIGLKYSDQKITDNYYRSLIDEKFSLNENNETKIQIYSFNRNYFQIFKRTKVNYKLYRINKKKKEYRRSRIIELPDICEVSEKNYADFFPLDSYQLKKEVIKVPYNLDSKEFADFFHKNSGSHKSAYYQLIDTDSLITTKENSFISFKKINSAEYLLSIESKDAEQKFYHLTLYADNEELPYTNKIYTGYENKLYEPGESVSIDLGFTTYKPVTCRMLIEKSNDFIAEKEIELNKKLTKIELPVLEKYRGGIKVWFQIITDNRIYSKTISVAVPWNNKKLKVKLNTFRSELKTGQKEKWTINISGFNNYLHKAELFLTMYDASLVELLKNKRYSYYLSYDFMDNVLAEFSKFYRYPNQSGSMGYCTSENIVNQKRSLDLDTINFIEPTRAILNSEFVDGKFPNTIYQTRDFQSNSIKVDNNNFGAFSGVIYHIPQVQNINQYDNPSGNSWAALDKISFRGVGESSYFRIPFLKPGKYQLKTNKKFIPFTIYKGMETRKCIILDFRKYSSNSDVTCSMRTIGDEAFSSPKKEYKEEISSKGSFTKLPLRRNFRENVFFYPHLKTDFWGNIEIDFTMPDRITKWRFLGLAHTKDLKYGFLEGEVTTKKEVMIISDPPRFLREGDSLRFSAKITNLTKNFIKGKTRLELYNASTGEKIDSLCSNLPGISNFSADSSSAVNITFPLKVPEDIAVIKYRIFALTKNHSDGEERFIPVLKKKKLITESFPISIYKKGEKEFSDVFTKITNSTTHQPLKLTFEYTQNPIWNILTTLPYIMEYPYECNEQKFSRLYGNIIGSYLLKQTPEVEKVFQTWQKKAKQDTCTALAAKLMQNQELKEILLTETPWFKDARKDENHLFSLAKLYDFTKMENNYQSTYNDLMKSQHENGAWSWYGKDSRFLSRYTTTYIVAKFGQLNVMNALPETINNWKHERKMKQAIAYLDNLLLKDFNQKDYNLNYERLLYFYARTFHKVSLEKKFNPAYDFYFTDLKKNWTAFNLYGRALIAIIMIRNNEQSLASEIIKSITEHLVERNNEIFVNKKNGLYWYQNQTETVAMIIEALKATKYNNDYIDKMKYFLLNHKRLNSWGTTKATSEVCYTILNSGSDWLKEDNGSVIKIGKKIIDTKTDSLNGTAGTGYFKKSWYGENIEGKAKKVFIRNRNQSPAYGRIYYQYFENLDKIESFSKSPLKIKKSFSKASDSRKIITDSDSIKVGDIIKIVLEFESSADLEYIHLKDLRAASFEPVDVFSGYEWNRNFYSYKSIKKASIDYFIENLRKGKHKIEYEVKVTHSGKFSTGLANIQSMYAPEYSGHSESRIIEVND